MSSESTPIIENNLSGQILQSTHVHVQKCYQCGKCSAGCPLSTEMDYPPSLLLRMLQLGTPEMEDKVLRSYSIWVCLTCEMCLSRCPMEIDIPNMMDFLRQKSIKEGKVNPRAKKIIAFHEAFLDSIRKGGRLNEMGSIMQYKLKTLELFKDVLLAPKMFATGKLHLVHEKIKDTSLIKRIFKNTKNK